LSGEALINVNSLPPIIIILSHPPPTTPFPSNQLLNIFAKDIPSLLLLSIVRRQATHFQQIIASNESSHTLLDGYFANFFTTNLQELPVTYFQDVTDGRDVTDGQDECLICYSASALMDDVANSTATEPLPHADQRIGRTPCSHVFTVCA
jgi:hypothetical protein